MEKNFPYKCVHSAAMPETEPTVLHSYTRNLRNSRGQTRALVCLWAGAKAQRSNASVSVTTLQVIVRSTEEHNQEGGWSCVRMNTLEAEEGLNWRPKSLGTERPIRMPCCRNSGEK